MSYWRIWLSVVALVVAAWSQVNGTAQNSTQTSTNSTAASAGANANAQSHQEVQAVLSKTVDAKKAKEGDVVEAKTTTATKTAEKVDVPKGSKLIGHVTQAKAKTKGSEDSKLGVLFDKAVLKGGMEVPFHAMIVAATAPETPSIGSGSDMSAGMVGSTATDRASSGPTRVGGVSGGALGTVGSTAGSLGSGASQTVGSVASSTVGAQTNSSANGVNGMALHGITLDTQASNTTNGSVFQSNQQNVKLESGTVIVVRATKQ